MGQASGKLTISHVDNKSKQETHGENEVVVQTVNAAQPATVKHNASGEAPQADQSAEHGPNGSVNTAEAHDSSNATVAKQKDEKSAKKSKNPLVWIQRRLSKRMSTSKKTVTDKETEELAVNADAKDAASPEEAAQTATAVEQQQVVETASSLVEQVLNTAVVQQMSEHNTEQTPVAAEVIEHQPEKSAPEAATEPVNSMNHVSAEYSSEETRTTENTTETHQDLVSQPEDSEKVEQVESEPVLDTNNTNSEYVAAEQQQPLAHGEPETPQFDKSDEQGLVVDGDANMSGHDYEQDGDAMAAKLANLELTNGHSEQHAINNGIHSDVVVNGE